MDPLSAPSFKSLPRFFTALFLGLGLLVGCAQTEITESPKTAFTANIGESKTPELVWSSKTLERGFDYLGQIKTRAWTYDGAIERLIDGGKSLGADAIVDIHFERIGFFNSMSAFAVKYR